MNTMLNDPVMQYRLIKAEQRERWRMAERARQASVAPQKQTEQVEPEEVAPLTGLIERILQNGWKRLGLPARQPGPRLLPAPSGGLPSSLE
jgi:hypothetical protein